MPVVRRSNASGPDAWEWIGPGSATGRGGTGGSTLADIPRDQPPRRLIVADLSNATPRQLEALDMYIELGDQRKAAKALGIGERRFHRLLYSLREATGMTIVQLALMRDRQRGAR